MTESQKKYDRLNTVKFTIKLNVNTDSELIKLLNASDNKQGLIKRALYNYLPDMRIINSIRAEAEKLKTDTMYKYVRDFHHGVDTVIEIIDKYR